MKKILIAQMYCGRGSSGRGDLTKATFTMDQINAAVEAEGAETLTQLVDGCHGIDLFYEGPCMHIFEPIWSDYDGGVQAVFDQVLAGEQVIIVGEETMHALAIDTGAKSRKTLIDKLRSEWLKDFEGDDEGWG